MPSASRGAPDPRAPCCPLPHDPDSAILPPHTDEAPEESHATAHSKKTQNLNKKIKFLLILIVIGKSESLIKSYWRLLTALLIQHMQ